MKNTVQLFRALADETRLRILALLLNSGELCVCDLTATLKLPQSTVSRHLSYLRNAGLVSDRREGVWIYYTAATDNVLKQQLAKVLKERLSDLECIADDLTRLASLGKGLRCS